MTRDTAASVLAGIPDPVAARLGKRYKPIAMSPARQGAIVARSIGALGATGLSLLAVGAWATYAAAKRRGRRRLLAVAMAALAACALGFVWGRVIENTSGAVENALLFVVIPLAALFGFGVVLLASRDQPDRILRRGAWLATMGCFYGGYGVGWLALWGYLQG
jgi:hypothetical protein